MCGVWGMDVGVGDVVSVSVCASLHVCACLYTHTLHACTHTHTHTKRYLDSKDISKEPIAFM